MEHAEFALVSFFYIQLHVDFGENVLVKILKKWQLGFYTLMMIHFTQYTPCPNREKPYFVVWCLH